MDDSIESPFYVIPLESKNAIAKTSDKFLKTPSSRNMHIDKVEWPFDIACSGVNLINGRLFYF